jgi:hypothetical protein
MYRHEVSAHRLIDFKNLSYAEHALVKKNIVFNETANL